MIEKLFFDDFEKIVLNGYPLIDVRSPIEFNKGGFPGSINLPLLDDQQRHLIGCHYKTHGQSSAIRYANSMVTPSLKEEKITAWQTAIKQAPDSLIYCFRGGLRSKISQEWLAESGYQVPRLDGGYKAFRHFLIDALSPATLIAKPIIVGGYTGSGKTRLINRFKQSIDLEGIANHRGSSFGRRLNGQPSQIDFENRLAYALLKHQSKGYKYLLLEDEGRHVGRCFLPADLADFFKHGELIQVDVPLNERVDIILNDYIRFEQKKFLHALSLTDGLSAEQTLNQRLTEWKKQTKESLFRIQKRLGLVRYHALSNLLDQAFTQQKKTGTDDGYRPFIAALLTDYYDPMYTYQLAKHPKPCLFKGSMAETERFLNSLLSDD